MSLPPDAKRTLVAVLDGIVPPSGDGRLPGAGELGIADFVEAGLAEQPELRTVVAGWLSRLDVLAEEHGGRAFAALPAPTRREVLDAATRALPGFPGPLLLMTYLGYYRHPRVLEALGLEARPPFPEGHAVPPTDLSILDPVRTKAPFYRSP